MSHSMSHYLEPSFLGWLVSVKPTRKELDFKWPEAMLADTTYDGDTWL